jgi:hypothetical protein
MGSGYWYEADAGSVELWMVVLKSRKVREVKLKMFIRRSNIGRALSRARGCGEVAEFPFRDS